MSSSKAWYKSKTIWANALVLGLAAAETQLNVLKDVLPGGLFAWVSFGLPVLNAALRFISTSTLTASKPKAASS